MTFMIMVHFPGNPAPKTYFFSDAPTANRFYYMKKEDYKSDDYFKETKIGLWRLSDDGRSWVLKLSNYD